MKKQLIAFGIIIVLLAVGLSGCFGQNEENSVDIDESKNKLAVIVKKDGIFDTSEIRDDLSSFLDAVKSDLDIDNVGVCRADVDSLDDLDQFIENLYYEDDIGYIIMIGRNLAWEDDGWKELKSDMISAFQHVNDELCYLEEREPDQQGMPPGISGIKDMAVSWIMAPDICYSNKTLEEITDMKRAMICDTVSMYTCYHNNPREILNQFKQSVLYVRDSSALTTFYWKDFDNKYQFDWTLVMNIEYNMVWEEMQKKHLVLDYIVHGTRRSLTISQSASDASTTVDDYAEFIEKNGLPALFVDASACECKVFQRDCTPVSSGINYCWPQVNICNGVWAYYSMPSSACKALSTTSPFIGHVLRHYQTSAIVFGDITAHMK